LRSLTDAHPTYPVDDESDATDLEKKTAKERRFEEEYVLAEVEWLKQQEIVKHAIEERGLQVHAFVYDKEKNTNWRLVDDEGKSMEIANPSTGNAEEES
jgi:carbonic anhydrase